MSTEGPCYTYETQEAVTNDQVTLMTNILKYIDIWI